MKKWRLMFPTVEEQKLKVSKKILKKFNKVFDGKVTQMDIESIGKVYLLIDLDDDHAKTTTHIVKAELTGNGYIAITTRKSTYYVNPDNRAVEAI